MNVQAAASRLGTPAGFRSLFTGFWGGRKARKSFAIYAGADKKGLFPLEKLRSATRDGSQYAVYAFWPGEEIPYEVLRLIADRLSALSLGVLRYECLRYTQLERWRGGVGSRAHESREITGIAPDYPEILIFPVADDVNCEYVIYARHGGEHYIYPITRKQAEEILA